MTTTDQKSNLADLLARVAMGDRKAFKALYDQTSAQLFGNLMRILKQQSLAEDALQEAFFQIWKNADRFQATAGEPMSWLHSIARYRAIDMLRRKKPEISSVSVEQDLTDSEPALGYFDKMQESDSAGLMQCLSALEPKHRYAIVMCYCEGYSHSELSERMSTALGTVKSWIRRGLITLRECLEQ